MNRLSRHSNCGAGHLRKSRRRISTLSVLSASGVKGTYSTPTVRAIDRSFASVDVRETSRWLSRIKARTVLYPAGYSIGRLTIGHSRKRVDLMLDVAAVRLRHFGKSRRASLQSGPGENRVCKAAIMSGLAAVSTGGCSTWRLISVPGCSELRN